MEVAISFAGGKKESIKLNNLRAGMRTNMHRGLKRAGVHMEASLKKQLKDSNPTTFFAPSHNWRLASRTGRLRASITHRMGRSSMGEYVEVGPNVVYAAIHEFGGDITVTDKMRGFLHWRGVHLRKSTTKICMPKRAWFFPTFERERPTVVREIEKEITRPLRG